jgi:hypothetical protein
MAIKKVSQYDTFSLDWLVNKAEELKQYVDGRPLHLLEDRMAYKETKGGGVIPVVISTIEQQRADLSKAVKDYGEIYNQIKLLKERDQAKLEKRGGGKVAGILNDE